jgi:HK97 family phage major capsid protein
LIAGDNYLKEAQGPAAAHLGWRDSGPTEGMAAFDPQSWHELKMQVVERDPIYGIPVVVAKSVRFHVPEAVMAKGYSGAFEAYCRRGKANLGPQDSKTLVEGSDSAGGFLVPEDYHVELIKKIAALATIRANARIVSTSRDIAKWPKIQWTTDDLYTSGVRFTWTGESPASATAHRVTDPVFGMHSIPIHTAMASMPLSNDFLEDSAFDVVGVSSDLLSEAFALGENDVFVNGDGAGKPMGIVAQVDDAGNNGPRSVKSGSAGTLMADGVIDLAYSLPAQYERNAKFFMRKSTEKVVRKLKDTTNEYLWPITGSLGVVPRELLGYPTIREEFVPTLGANTYPIIFGDLNGYLIVDRVGFSIQRLSEIYAETNITLLLARKRVGGQTVEPWRIKVQKVSA